MSDFIAPTGRVCEWIGSLASKHPVFFPQKHGEVNFRFAPLKDGSAVQFEHYRPTVVPPVKLLVPAREELLTFEKKEDGGAEVTATVDASFRVLAGVRPCDLKGIFLMDLFFKDGVTDPYYLARRENTAIVAYGCAEACDDRVFCAAVDSLDHSEGADVFLTPIAGDDIVVEAKTRVGEELLEGTDFNAVQDGPARRIGAVAARPDAYGRALQADVSALASVINVQWKSPVWEKHVEKCFSCGTCNLVCPTCFCFDVHDDLNLDAASGSRSRTWDACMLPHFASVAGGHNFRPEPAARQRHRVKRKFEYLPKKYGYGAVCVGCGRCGRQCTSGIDIYDIVNDLAGAGGQP
jgi:ferredoxin